MKKVILLVFLLTFVVLPFVSADLITPGFEPMNIDNKISNFDDFSDYYLLTVCNPPMPRVSLIEGGVIGSCYKFSKLDVYVVKKSNFNLSELSSIENLNYTEFPEYIGQSRFKLVIDNAEHYKEVPVSSTQKSITNYYTIDLNQVKTSPDSKNVQRNWLFYAYIIIPIIALIIIIFIVWKRKKQ